MIQKSEWETWLPTPEMIRAAETVFLAIAHTETIRPIVTAYQKKILADMQVPYADEWQRRGMHTGEVVLNPDHTYLMEDADFRHYLKRCREEQAKAGLHTDSPDHCPLLVAECLQRDAEHALIAIMVPVTGLTFDQIMRSSHAMENLKKYLDLTLRMFAGYVHTGSEIMKRVK